jgi:hypothetical protein
VVLQNEILKGVDAYGKESDDRNDTGWWTRQPIGCLTKNLAKPAVPFGSRYRIVDFTLSNCSNSGIETVGVLTQYQPLDLNTYIGNGQPWDLDRIYGGAYILPPYQKSSGSDWYKGTANAIYQNTRFIDNYDPHLCTDPFRRSYLQDELCVDAEGPHRCRGGCHDRRH